MPKTPTPRVSWVLIVVLVAALATGAAASILVSASTAPPAPGPATLVFLPQWVLSLVSVGIIVFVVGGLVLWRLSSGGPSSILNRMTVTVLMVVFLGILFVLGARLLGFGGPVDTGSSGGSPGGTTPPPNNTTNPHPIVTPGGPGGRIVVLPGFPSWVPFVILGVIVLLVAVVGVPQVRRYLAERREGDAATLASATAVPAGMRAALARASTELDLGGDPRVVILTLYASMLEHLQPMVDDLGTSTPEEIRVAHLVRLGVRPEAARTLTRLFEEARYSFHPMGPVESTRAQEAVRATLDDLDRRTISV